MEARPHKRKLLRGSATHSTISMGQVELAFSRRQQCLFKIKIGTFKDIKVCSSQENKRRKFPDVILTNRQKTDYFHACSLRYTCIMAINNPTHLDYEGAVAYGVSSFLLKNCVCFNLQAVYQLSGPVYKSTWRYFTSALLLTSISSFVIDFLFI